MIKLAAAVLANSDYAFGFELGKRFGSLPAILIILGIFFGPWLLVRAIRKGQQRQYMNEQIRRQEDEELRLLRGAEGPPRFNG